MKNVWKWDIPEWGNVFTAASRVNLRVIEFKMSRCHSLLNYFYEVDQLQKRDWEASFVYAGAENTYQNCGRIRFTFLSCIWEHMT